MISSRLTLKGYDILGSEQNEGVRYAWKFSSSDYLVESASFFKRSKSANDSVCGYTTSVSSGCILCHKHISCKFCRTGTHLPFGGLLTSAEIAKQNVFMVLTDMYCSDHENIRSNAREFAYMGQGEPGFSYDQIRNAINITNFVMNRLGQTTYRHIIATSGVPKMIHSFKGDLREGFFSSRVTMHFSLHGTKGRECIMPIDVVYPYKDSLNELSEIIDICGEKPCIGILLLNNFTPKDSRQSYSNTIENMPRILDELNPDHFRLSFCEFNDYSDLGKFEYYDSTMANDVLSLAKHRGFEAKLFSSFGKKEVSACGMLGGKTPMNEPSTKWLELEQITEDMVAQAELTINNI
jgi:adenine C2-methylase RlmN of 23S rRNA A2503 and tRNA A37